MKAKTIILSALGLFAALPVYAATATPSAIDEIKERLATKVAELRQVEKRAFFGTVKAKSLSTLTVETKTKDIKIELNDDIKVVQIIKGKRTNLTIDNVEKGDVVSFLGDYDSAIDLLKASLIFIEGTFPTRLSGKVTKIDREDFSLTVGASDNQTYTVDIEKTSKVLRWDKVNKITKSGFSKMTEGETIHFVGTPVPKKENRYSALRILNLGNPIGEPPPTPTPTPTPEKQSSPSATPKPTP